MGDTIKLEAKKRDLKGTKPNTLRAEGNVPAVIHDHGKDSHHILVNTKDLSTVYHKAGKHAPVELEVDGKKFTTLIKEVTYKPATAKMYHTVFQAVKANEKVNAQIPIKLSEGIPAEKASLLVVLGIDHVEVEALPKDLVDEIVIDANTLVGAGDKLTVADIKAPAGVTVTTEPDQLVASVEIPKDQIAEADAAAADLAADADKPAAEDSSESETPAESPDLKDEKSE